MRILVLGAGVVGSVYAVKLQQSGHEVVVMARGRRLEELQTTGLVLHDAESGQRVVLPVAATAEPTPEDRFDVVLVAVRAEQLSSTLPALARIDDQAAVVFFGNVAGHERALCAALTDRVLFGFPAVGGVQDGAVTRYVVIQQQQTMLGERTGELTPRVQSFRAALRAAGFPTTISHDICAWLTGHAAFVVPIAFALYAHDIDPERLAADRAGLRAMVLATREAFVALRAAGNREVPRNLQVLYLWLPAAFAVRYWRRELRGPHGELWFGAHSRAAPQEMQQLALALQHALAPLRCRTPTLDRLLTGP